MVLGGLSARPPTWSVWKASSIYPGQQKEHLWQSGTRKVVSTCSVSAHCPRPATPHHTHTRTQTCRQHTHTLAHWPDMHYTHIDGRKARSTLVALAARSTRRAASCPSSCDHFGLIINQGQVALASFSPPQTPKAAPEP